MGCSSCGGSSVSSNPSSFVYAKNLSQVESLEPCEYTNEMLNDYLNRLYWFKDTGKFIQQKITPATINKYLGIVLTSLNINYKCTYKKDLAAITDLVNLIITLQNVPTGN